MVKKTQPYSFVVPSNEFRALPVPGIDEEANVKLASCFIPCESLPSDLHEWMSVNPRKPEVMKNGSWKSPVARAMISTLTQMPQRFSLMNQGIWMLADTSSYEKEKGGQGFATISFSDPKRHGIANGGHTYNVIRKVLEERAAQGDKSPLGAYVRLHIITGISHDALEVSELALGLNRSIQVDEASIKNLEGKFAPIKTVLAKKFGGDNIAFRQGDTGPVDVETVLTLMNLFDVSAYPDWMKYPNGLFGHSKVVLDNFTSNSIESFNIVTPRVHELLVLSEKVMEAVTVYLAQVKVSDADTAKRLGNAASKREGYFSSTTVPKHFPVGWLYPMVGAFRANVDRQAWKRGKFEWLAPIDEVLPAVAEQMAKVVYQEHKDNKHKPGEVGRKEAAYRSCYMTVMMKLASMGVQTS